MNTWGFVGVIALMVIGVVGVVVPLLPGTILVGLGIGIWAAFTGGNAWYVFAAAVGCMMTAWAVKYVVGGRSMTRAGVAKSSLIVGGLVGIVLFFVIPVIGLLIGFVGGTFAAESLRLNNIRAGWKGAIAATTAAGLVILIELAGALFAVAVWAIAVLA